jgi:L-fucono-1,5-lactonase
MTVVDAHHHYWRIDARPRTPAHDYEPEHLRGELRSAGVTATVLVQSADEPAENDRLRAYQSATRTVAGVVAWLPLRDPTAARRELDRIDGMPRLSGVRCLVGREPLDWLAGADVRALFGELADRGLAWDVVAVTTDQVEAVCELAAAVPKLRIVVDHLARPPLDGLGEVGRERPDRLRRPRRRAVHPAPVDACQQLAGRAAPLLLREGVA